MEKEIDQWLLAHREELIADIQKLVDIKSVSQETEGPYPFGEGCAKALDTALAMAENYGFSTQNYGYRCGAAFLGDKTHSIGVFAHLDVVPEGNNWTYSPYQCRLEGDYLVGRGTADDKGPAMAGLYAMRCMRDLQIPMKYGTTLVFGCNEEAGMNDIGAFVEAEGAPLFSFTPDTDFPVCNGEKGILSAELISYPVDGRLVSFEGGLVTNMVADLACATLKEVSEKEVQDALEKAEKREKLSWESCCEGIKITARGVSAHAAFPYSAENAIGILASFLADSGLLAGRERELLQSVTKLLSDCNGISLGVDFEDDLSGKLTHIGGVVSMKEGRLIQNINIRYSVTLKGEELIPKLEQGAKALGFEGIKILTNSEPSYVKADTPAIEALTGAYAQVMGKKVPPYVMGGGTYARHLPNAVAFGPDFPEEEKPFGPGRGHAHEPDECVGVTGLLKAIKIYVLALAELNRLELSI